jgi:ribosomal protein S18 acetylase RimI-like enzyme
VVVGLIVSAVVGESGRELLAVGVAPFARRRGLASALLGRHVDVVGEPLSAVVTVAERDPFEPLDRGLRADIARRLLDRSGFRVVGAPAAVRRVDPLTIAATHPGPG